MASNLDNVYRLIGDIDDASIDKLISWFVSRITESGRSAPLNLIISSGGGWVGRAFAFVDLVLASGAELNTFAIGNVDSMAIPIFVAGSRRIIAPRATMLFHEMGRTFTKDTRHSLSELTSRAKDLSRSQQVYADLVSKRSKISPGAVIDLMKEERTVSAEQAVEIGIAHEILDQSNFPFRS